MGVSSSEASLVSLTGYFWRNMSTQADKCGLSHHNRPHAAPEIERHQKLTALSVIWVMAKILPHSSLLRNGRRCSLVWSRVVRTDPVHSVA